MIKKILLSNFRNFTKKEFEFSDEVTVVVGHNAVGKTNILESLFFLSTGKSFKARSESEMIKYGEDVTRVRGSFLGHEELNLEAIITSGNNSWPKKRLLVNGVPKRMIDFAGKFKTVLFGPEDLELVTDSPSLRRKFLDNVLSQVDRLYRSSLLSYEKGLRQRNRLLLRIREEGLSRTQLMFWNQLLIKNGDYITKKREEFIDYVNDNSPLIISNYKLEYDRSVISEGRLEQYAREEVAAATTLVGPHRDDFKFVVKFQMPNDKLQTGEERDLAAFGSRGEQRMGVLWLKMKELDFVEKVGMEAGAEIKSARPTLLLDDIFSELDHEHRELVMELSKKQQTIITTADEHYLNGFKEEKNKIINL